MSKVRDIQLRSLEELKKKSYIDLKSLMPGMAVLDEGLKPGESIKIEITLTKGEKLFVFSSAKELPPPTSQQDMIASLVGVKSKVRVLKTGWEDGFYMDKHGNIESLNSSDRDE